MKNIKFLLVFCMSILCSTITFAVVKNYQQLPNGLVMEVPQSVGRQFTLETDSPNVSLVQVSQLLKLFDEGKKPEIETTQLLYKEGFYKKLVIYVRSTQITKLALSQIGKTGSQFRIDVLATVTQKTPEFAWWIVSGLLSVIFFALFCFCLMRKSSLLSASVFVSVVCAVGSLFGMLFSYGASFSGFVSACVAFIITMLVFIASRDKNVDLQDKAWFVLSCAYYISMISFFICCYMGLP